jgi:hypothetical protein
LDYYGVCYFAKPAAWRLAAKRPAWEEAVHPVNWYFGWALILSAFVTGATLGLFFHREDFLGGYASFRRRIVRLGHISQAALGMLNVLYGLSPWPEGSLWEAQAASLCYMIGGIAMPCVCYLTGWREQFRHLFFVPVAALVLAVIYTLQGGPP